MTSDHIADSANTGKVGMTLGVVSSGIAKNLTNGVLQVS